MPDVVLIRPGCTDFDEQDRIQGTLELPLNAHGRQQLQEVCAQLRQFPIEIVYAAPGEPARSTAEAVAAELDVPVRECEGLRNLDQGLWQGLQLEDVRRKYPRVYKQWRDSPQSICPPEGEMVAEALERIRKCLQKPLKRKTPFAVVVSEPLASLVACVVRGSVPEHPGPICGGGKGGLVEVFRSNGSNGVGPAADIPQQEASSP